MGVNVRKSCGLLGRERLLQPQDHLHQESRVRCSGNMGEGESWKKKIEKKVKTNLMSIFASFPANGCSSLQCCPAVNAGCLAGFSITAEELTAHHRRG